MTLKIILNAFCVISIQAREPCLGIMKQANIVFRLDVMIDTTEFYSAVLICMTLTFKVTGLQGS